MVKIHYLQHVPFEGLAQIKPWANDGNHQLGGTHLYKNEPLPQRDHFDWLIILGGPMNLYEEETYPWLVEEKRLIEEAIAHHKTVLGICLGAQLIAHVLGARVYPSPYPEIGWFPITKTAQASHHSVFSWLPNNFNAFHWHGDTFDIPRCATHLAYSGGCQHQAFAYGNQVFGLQFHLESTQQSIQQLLYHCGDDLQKGPYVQTIQEILSDEGQFQSTHSTLDIFLNQLINHIPHQHLPSDSYNRL